MISDKALRLDSTCARAETLGRGRRGAKGFDASASASSAGGEEGERTTGGGGESPRPEGGGGSAKSGGKRGTPEQEKLIAKIKKAGADYEVLGWRRGRARQILKGDRKLVAPMHPDKCQRTAPRRCSRR